MFFLWCRTNLSMTATDQYVPVSMCELQGSLNMLLLLDLFAMEKTGKKEVGSRETIGWGMLMMEKR